MRARPATSLVAFATLLSTLALPLAPGAGAHCELGPQPVLREVARPVTEQADALLDQFVSHHPDLSEACLVNTPIEAVVDAVNEAADGELALVLIMYQRFHPEVVRIEPGGTVLWWALDPQEWTPSVKHTVTSTGPCLDPAADPRQDAQSCKTTDPGACFDSEVDLGGTMPGNGRWVYFETLSASPVTGGVWESFGLLSGSLVGQLTGAEPLRPCPLGTGLAGALDVAVPYHCHYHGVEPEPERGPWYGKMRGTILIGG